MFIDKQLSIIEQAIQWTVQSLPVEKQKNTCRHLIHCRRALKNKKFALNGKPAVAISGESQVGKSYLVSSLLSENGSPFCILDPLIANKGINSQDNNEGIFNFINEINPRGQGEESTSIVTRFSANYQPVNTRFPIKVALLSPVDVVLILCDSFYNDIKKAGGVIEDTDRIMAVQSDRIDRIKAEIATLKTNLQDRPAQQDVIGEDDIWDIRDYFESYFSTQAVELFSSGFFDEIPCLISKAKPHEWKGIFSLLWDQNEIFTGLFADLMTELERLNFCPTVYLPVTSVLVKYGTLLDVKRLHEIYQKPIARDVDFIADTTVLCVENDRSQEIKCKKSYLCALAAELVFSLPDTLLTGKPFLRETDLLDLPGVRSRMVETTINKENISQLLIRGKVAYLFNKYANNDKINLLLFCANHLQAANRSLPTMLNNWICKTVGNTPDERDPFIKDLQIPPLFIISTFFNVDMQYNPQLDIPQENKPLNDRWAQRFESILAKEYIGVNSYGWFENWTTSQPNFQNIYLLRDFAKSESISHLFTGYVTYNIEKEEVEGNAYPQFREQLRNSFITNPFVKKHFKDPAVSWDKAASINQDGTELIINNLTIAANHINEVRSEKIRNELKEIERNVLHELKSHYHSSEPDENLQKAKSMAGDMQRKLDIAFGKNPYFFGQMIKALMIDKKEVYNWFVEQKHYSGHTTVIDRYSVIRMNVPTLDGNAAFDENLEQLCVHYNIASKEACQSYFETEGIHLNTLFFGNKEKEQTFPQRLAKELEAYWFKQLTIDNKAALTMFLPESNLIDLFEMLKKLFEKLMVSELIAQKIAGCMIDDNRIDDNTCEMIADVSAEIINEFINSVGYKWLTESDLKRLKDDNDNVENDLQLVLDHHDLFFDQANAADAARLMAERIKTIDRLPHLRTNEDLIQAIQQLPHYRNYKLWYDMMKTGFIHVCNIPSYNVEANKKLKAIIESAYE